MFVFGQVCLYVIGLFEHPYTWKVCNNINFSWTFAQNCSLGILKQLAKNKWHIYIYMGPANFELKERQLIPSNISLK